MTEHHFTPLYPTLPHFTLAHAGLIITTRGMERGTCTCIKAAVLSCECVNGIVGTQRRVEKGPN